MFAFYAVQGKVTAFTDDSGRFLTVQWKKLDDDVVIQECCHAQLQQVNNGVKTIIIDSSAVTGSISNVTNDWFGTTFIPKVRDAGLKAMIKVQPQKNHCSHEKDLWIASHEHSDFNMVEADTLEDAIVMVQLYH